MARPTKQNADYFEHDANASADEKIMYLESLFGPIGYAFFFKMLEILTNADRFEIDLSPKKMPILAKKIGVDYKTFQELIDASTDPEIDAFRIKDGKLFSKGLKKRFQPLIDKRRRDRKRKSAENTTKEEVFHTENEVIDSDYKQSRAEQSKGEQRRDRVEQNRAKESDAKGPDGLLFPNGMSFDSEFQFICFQERYLFDTPLSALTDKYKIGRQYAQKLTRGKKHDFLWRKIEYFEWVKIHKPELCSKGAKNTGYLCASIEEKNGSWPPPAGYEEWRENEMKSRRKAKSNEPARSITGLLNG